VEEFVFYIYILIRVMIERKDAKRNLWKVAKEVLKNPYIKQRDIAKKANISLWNVNDKLERLEQIENSNVIDKICEQDKEIMDLVNWISIIKIKQVKNKIENYSEEVSINEVKTLADIAEKSTRRYTLFKWDVTNKDWWLKSTKELDNTPLEELKDMISSLTR